MAEGRELDPEEILAGVDDELPEDHRSGMVALVGRPNVGKSTLLNRLVGEKVAIVTETPGTTRNAIRGVLTRDDAQVVFLDLPGLAKPRTLLTRRLNGLVRDSLGAVEVVCFMVDVAAGVGRGDEHLAGEIAEAGAPVVVAANKEDAVGDKHDMIPHLERLAELTAPGSPIVPVSATTGFQVERLVELLVERLPRAPRLFPTGRVSDQPEHQLAAELLREQLIARVSEELPHSIAVEVVDIRPGDHRDDVLAVDATVYVERESQKGIVIGQGGERLKEASSAARHELEALFGMQVFLDTHVTVAPDWQTDAKELQRLGF